MWYGSDYEAGIFLATSTDGLHWEGSGAPAVGLGSGASVLHDASGWKMWFEAWDGQGSGLFLATSSDAANWTVEGEVMAGAHRPKVIHVGADNEMWFTRLDGHIRYATSRDGRTWREGGVSLAPGPVGAWDDLPESATVVRVGSTYRMWYAAYYPKGGIGAATLP
jgi:predicted GH43/DUF377 family glycosyl hydrolase